MSETSSFKWYLARFAIVATTVIGGLVYPREQSNLDWLAAVIVSVMCGVALCAWLTAVRKDPSIEWSRPYALGMPFMPMRKYPLRYWAVGAMSLGVAGMATLMIDIASGRGNQGFGGTFLALGTTLYLVVVVWKRLFGKDGGGSL